MSDSLYTRENAAGLHTAVRRIVDATPVTDMHTHLYGPAFGELLLYGIDELLVYHYLVAEALRVSTTEYPVFWGWTKREQADFIWNALFIERSPISESCRGVVTVLDSLGLDTASRNLEDYRAYFAGQQPDAFVDTVMQTANVKGVVMTNDPLDAVERPVWESGYKGDPRFHAALRIDPILNHWHSSAPKLATLGYHVDSNLNSATLAEIRRFLSDWLKRMNALYMAVSLPPNFMFPERTDRARILCECVLPVAREFNIPFAMMIGVKRDVNPALRLASDGVGRAEVQSVEVLCADYPDTKFMVTMLSRENQHELCVLARKFRNLCLFGCWWFLNVPSLIEEMTSMRLELLGTGVIPQHSDARVLDQIIYKWNHSRAIVAKVLAEKYARLIDAGWAVSDAEIQRDAARLLDGNFWEFVKP